VAPAVATVVTVVSRNLVHTIDIPDEKDHHEQAGILDLMNTESRVKQHAVIEEVKTNESASHITQTPLPQPSNRLPIPTQDQCACKQYCFNKSCSLKLCKGCCAGTAAYCVVLIMLEPR
jgi:hypothetical protein